MEEKREEGENKDTESRKDEREKRTVGRPSRAEELSRIRDRAGSQTSIIDYVKNKRGREEERESIEKAEKEILDSFGKGNREIRSPPNKIKREEKKEEGMEMEKMLKEIIAKMDEQEKERKKDKEEIMKEIQEMREDYRMREILWEEQKARLENRIKQLEEKVGKMEDNGGGKLVSEFTKKMKEMERNSEIVERRRRRNNIIIKGMKVENGSEGKEKMKKFLEEEITKKMEVEEVQTIGRGEYKMTLVRFNRWEDKKEIMVKRKEIGKARKIFIDDDLTAVERQIQKHLWSIVREEREKGKKATVGYQRIWIDNCEWKWRTEKLERKAFQKE
ncbi:PREDICTED: trichohyalin-like [Vollenhovia emeryi]|uniref:trichohyalin-like n=1 Tax=Vollenhovia emeryi TaxID=411798 RepID=UPI0005F41381|nr:PREDICTED: trichohyalin-like [Vollenhovia emeryi]